MPQLDIFIFLSSGSYLFLGFFSLLAYIHLYILPGLGSLIKLRKKLLVKKTQVNQIKLPTISCSDFEKIVSR